MTSQIEEYVDYNYVIYTNVIKMLEYRSVNNLNYNNNKPIQIQPEKQNTYINNFIKNEYYEFSIKAKENIIVMIFTKNSSIIYTKSKFDKHVENIYNTATTPHNLILISFDQKDIKKIEDRLSLYKKNSKIYTEILSEKLFACEVPKYTISHSIAEENDLQNFLKDRITSKDKFPKIICNGPNADACAVWLGAKPKQCIMVVRPSEPAGESIIYRYCI
jgi:DNA-directed RNA polymerase subunit H (RpoH/RPB5)